MTTKLQKSSVPVRKRQPAPASAPIPAPKAPHSTSDVPIRDGGLRGGTPASAPKDLSIYTAGSLFTPLNTEQLMLRLREARLPVWAILPLRAFLGGTFLYAGIQKLTDPGFFRPHSATYIGTQIAAFAHHSPLGGFLTAVALPHALLFGAIVAWGEVAIGLGALLGLLFRPAAFFGAVLSLVLWLSATWQVKPYFYGADIFSLFGWLTLLFAGTSGVLALDSALGKWLAPRLAQRLSPGTVQRILQALDLTHPAPEQTPPVAPTGGKRASRRVVPATTRRQFLQGASVGALATLVGVAFWNFVRGSATPADSALSGGLGSTASASSTGVSSDVIANLHSLPPNSATDFTIPSTQDPGVVVRLASGKVVAFDATCTHAGCPVQYDPSSQLLICPCHGAEFDPTQNAAVMQGPADQPLTPVGIAVNQQSGDITLTSS